MPICLYVAFDLFHAASYVPRQGDDRPPWYAKNDETYEHDAAHYYAILQPFLIADARKPADLPLLDYLTSWDAARLARPGALVFLGARARRALPEETNVIPVPFPADAVLELKATWANQGSFEVRRELGSAASPFAFPSSSTWPKFAAYNYMPVPIRRFEDLSGPQVKDLFAWAYGLMQSLENRRKSLEGKELLIYNEFFRDKPPGAPGDLVAWSKWLVDGGRLRTLMARVWNDRDLRDVPSLHPPSFRYDAERLEEAEPSIFGDVPPPSYHRWLIAEMKRVAENDAAHTDQEPTAPTALGRLFGFGERLRFPGPRDVASEKDFMIVRTKAERSPDWFVTNAPSLLGQVFRIGPIPGSLAALDFKLSTLAVCGHNLLEGAPDEGDEHPRTSIQDQFERAFLEAKENAASGKVFGASLAVDGAAPRVWFMPRNARPPSTELVHPSSQETIFAVPGTLLDVLEERPRTEMSLGQPTGDLSGTHPQRMFLASSDLARAGQYTDWSQTRRFARVKAWLKARALAGAPERALAYELSIPPELHQQDRPTVEEGLSGFEGNDAELWITQTKDGVEKLRSWPLKGRAQLLASGSSARLLVRDVNVDDQGSLTNILSAQRAAKKTSRSEEKYVVELAWRIGEGANLGATERFNILMQKDGQAPGPLFVLAAHFDHRVSRSADRLALHAALSLDPRPPGHGLMDADEDPSHPILGHFANFDKLRLDLVNDTQVVSLNHPDALIPIPPSADLPPPLAEASSAYWLAHQFTEEVRLRLDESEENRYRAYRSAGSPWRLTGHVEHQYSHRVPVDGARSLRLPLSSEVRNLATLANPGPEGDTKDPVIALTFDFVPAQAHPGPALEREPDHLTLSLELDYLAAITASARGTPETRGTPASLRPLYEALLDLAAAAQTPEASSAVVRLERWNFDNTKRTPAPAEVVDPAVVTEFPSIERSMRFGGAAELRLTASDVRPFTNLLGATFAEFAARVAAQKSSLTVTLDLARGWHWSDALDPVFPLASTTNVLRLGLRVGRDATAAIGEEYVQDDAQFVPLDTEREDAKREAPALGQIDPGAQRRAAREELRAKIHASGPLRRSFAWIQSLDKSRPLRPGTLDKDRRRKLFGESYPFLNFPDGPVRSVDPVVQLFHVPSSFVPLETHPAFIDPQTTLEFAEFLLDLLGSLRRGSQPDEIELTPEDDLGKAFEQWRRLDSLLVGPGGVADRLLGLLKRVDPEVLDAPLARQVDRCLAAIDGERKQVLRALLGAEPDLFATAKAIALGVFDPETYSEKLFALQVRKRIREGVDAPTQIADDSDRFSFARFFGSGRNRFIVDVLDDRSYDDDYHIRENDYTDGREPPRPHRRSEVKRLGDALGRTGEDVIEQENKLDDEVNDQSTGRSVLVDVVHYNPEWALKTDGVEKRYLLPSRRFPRAPKPAFPLDIGLRLSSGLADFARRDDLDGQFRGVMNRLMNREIELVSSSQPFKATPQEGFRAIVPPVEAEGWHQLDSYVSHYYFVVEPDEEGTFTNDVFQIFVDRHPKPFEPMAPVPPEEFKAITPLQDWFVYHRRREEAVGESGNAKKVKKPEIKLTLEKIINESNSWLTRKNAEAPFAERLLLEAQTIVNTPVASAQYALTEQGWVLKNTNRETTIGHVIAADLMSLGKDRPSVLHLAVFDDAWSYQRVCVRTLRNNVDLNGNEQVDINPVFRMVSLPSEWTDYGRDVLRPEVQGLPEAVAALRPSAPKLSLKNWVSMTQGVVDFGPMVREVVEKSFDSNGRKRFYWNGGKLLSPANKVKGVVLQVLRDVHPRWQKGGAVKEGDQARGDVLTKQIIPSRSADKCDELTAEWRREEILIARPHLRVIWSNESEKDVMEVTWPVKWS